MSTDQNNPWLGLASFTEETRSLFFGREEEVAELERRVQRKLLTILFGKSGLGKTSILQAGLVPGLRARGYFPVYLRIDYGRDSPEPAEQIKAGLEAIGITTWFDIDRLEVGDDYDRKIQRNISRCSYFIPVISATTQKRHEGYFRREWSYALDRARNMAEGALFILPVSLDATTAAAALVPDRFKGLHFTQLPEGRVTAEFGARLAEFMRGRDR